MWLDMIQFHMLEIFSVVKYRNEYITTELHLKMRPCLLWNYDDSYSN